MKGEKKWVFVNSAISPLRMEFVYWRGNSEPVVMLHGLLGDITNFSAIIPYLAGEFTIILPRLPIFEMPPPVTVEALLSALEDFLEEVAHFPIILVGNSLGGHLALMYTARHPDKVAGLVLAGSSGLYENSFGFSYPKIRNYDFVRERVEYTFYRKEVATPELVQKCFEVINERKKRKILLDLSRSAIRGNIRNLLKEVRINVPVGLVWGKNDRITPPHVAHEFATLIKNSVIYWIDRCGHVPMMEHPCLFAKIFCHWYWKFVRSDGRYNLNGCQNIILHCKTPNEYEVLVEER